ncbi:MAG: nucleotidyltransferase family protein [Candidatus Aureabacteria bacterium]|nr:nucleotidyltransferase family protein [Candidatus Auribacterota bacterium]
MKTLSDIENILKSQKPFLREKFKVNSIGVFGSYSRQEQTSASDVDVLVEFDSPPGWDFFDLQDYLEDLLGTKVDLVTRNAIKPQLQESILHEVVYA